MGKPMLRINEVAAEVGETTNVIRNWVQVLKQYIPLEKNDLGTNLFSEEAVQVVRKIQKMHRVQKFSMKQIEHNLAMNGKEFGGFNEVVVEKTDLEEMKELMKKQLEFNQAIIERLDNQEVLMRQRNDQLNLYFEQIKEKKTLENKSSPWWKFNRNS